MSNKRIFVTTDTHGCADELKKVLELAKFNYDIDRLIHLGDCVDRGPDSKGVIDILLSIKDLISIRGNHDDWLREYIVDGRHGAQWQQGASKTYESYLVQSQHEIFIPQSHKLFFIQQKNYYIDDQNRLFIHAGLDLHEKIEKQDNYMLFWDRDLIYQACSCKKGKLNDVNNFKRIFIGHTPTLMWNNKTKPIYAAQVVDLDTGIAYGGKITLIDITDDENHVIYQI